MIKDSSNMDLRGIVRMPSADAATASRPVREVYKIGLITDPDLILKFYGMLKHGEPVIPEHVVKNRETLLLEEIAKNKSSGSAEANLGIKTGCGAGFAVLSSGGLALNVAVWGISGHPHILFTHFYLGDRTRLETVEEKDVTKEGVCCAWEGGVFGYESKKWMKYLASCGTYCDLKRYLDDFLVGPVFQ